MQQHNATQSDKLSPMRDELADVESDLGCEQLRLDRLSAAAAVMQGKIRASAEWVATLTKRSSALRHGVAQPIGTLDEATTIAAFPQTRAGLATADSAKRRAALAILDMRCQVSGVGESRQIIATLGILESVTFTIEM